MRSAILRALAMSWVIESAVAPRSRTHLTIRSLITSAMIGIEAGGRLVEEDDLRLGGDGAGERHALLHAAGELGRKELADSAPPARRRPACRARSPWPGAAGMPLALDQPEGDVLPDRQTVEQGRALEQHAEVPAHLLAVAAGAGRPSPAPSIWIAAGIGTQQAEDAFDQHRLAGARAADDHDAIRRCRRRDRRRAAPASRRRICAARATAIFGCSAPPSSREEQLGEEVVETRIRIEAETTALVVAAPTPWAPPRELIAVVAAHQRDDEAEDRGLDQAGDHVDRSRSRWCCGDRRRG